jgi:HSP20 family protein
MAKEQKESQEQAGQEQGRQDPSRRTSEHERGVARREGAQRSTDAMMGSPFTLMRRFMEDLDGLLGGSGPSLMPRIDLGARGEGQTTWVPPVEMLERDGQFVVRVDVPGMNRDQINVEIEDGQLIVSGERTQEREDRREGFYRSERVYGSFYRVIPLPEGVDPGQARGTFANGVLEITMPAPKRQEARRLEIQEGGTQGKQPEGRSSEAKSA